jgi:hypothetical protein
MRGDGNGWSSREVAATDGAHERWRRRMELTRGSGDRRSSQETAVTNETHNSRRSGGADGAHRQRWPELTTGDGS